MRERPTFRTARTDDLSGVIDATIDPTLSDANSPGSATYTPTFPVRSPVLALRPADLLAVFTGASEAITGPDAARKALGDRHSGVFTPKESKVIIRLVSSLQKTGEIAPAGQVARRGAYANLWRKT